MIRFRLKRDFVDVPVQQARRLIDELQHSAWSPEMRRSAAEKISQAIASAETLPRITFSLGEKITLNETLREVRDKTSALPPVLHELRQMLTHEIDRARNRETLRPDDDRRRARAEQQRRRGFS